MRVLNGHGENNQSGKKEDEHLKEHLEGNEDNDSHKPAVPLERSVTDLLMIELQKVARLCKMREVANIRTTRRIFG